jgi:glc operon protein GlcG
MAHVTRDHLKLTLEGAQAVLAAAERRAREMNCPINIAVVDDGGHLLAFSRMDGAKPSSIEIAMVKARAAAMRRSPTGPAGNDPNLLIALGLAITGGGQQIPIRGGVPLIAAGEVVGAVGASAGSEDQDVEVAMAGAAALLVA